MSDGREASVVDDLWKAPPVSLPWARLRFSDSLFKKINPQYEVEIWDYLVCEGNAAVEVGAHQGFFTTKLARGALMVIAFEPMEINWRILKRNLHDNEIKNVIALEIALSDFDGLGELYSYDCVVPKNSGKHFLRGSSAPWDDATRPVPPPEWGSQVTVRRLDTIMHRLKDIEAPEIETLDLVKIDVEGAEIHVLRGAIGTLKRYKPRVVLEIHYDLGERVKEFLGNLGYRLVDSGQLTDSGNPYAVYEVPA